MLLLYQALCLLLSSVSFKSTSNLRPTLRDNFASHFLRNWASNAEIAASVPHTVKRHSNPKPFTVKIWLVCISVSPTNVEVNLNRMRCNKCSCFFFFLSCLWNTHACTSCLDFCRDAITFMDIFQVGNFSSLSLFEELYWFSYSWTVLICLINMKQH